MIISSRTPEGLPNRCPLCGKPVIIDPSRPFGDAPCPHCGHLLFFLNTPDEVLLASEPKATSLRERVLAFVAEQLGVGRDQVKAETSFVNHLGADSLDTVELTMELEEEFEE